MANPPETNADVSSKYSLPTKSSFMEEAKAYPSRKREISDNTSPSHFQKIVAELIGTYILIFEGCGAALVNKIQTLTIVGIGLVWGLVLMAMIYAVGLVSGAHFNPAVTIAFAASRKLSWKQVPTYVLAQLLEATLASLLRVSFNDQDNIEATMTRFWGDTTDVEAVTWEFIVTFILMFIICGAATDHRANKDFAGVAIGVTVLFNVIISGPITGASMNPARSLGPAVVSGVYKNLWVYMVAPIIGAMSAALVYSVLRIPKPEKPVQTKAYTINFIYMLTRRYTPTDRKLMMDSSLDNPAHAGDYQLKFSHVSVLVNSTIDLIKLNVFILSWLAYASLTVNI